MTDLQDLYQLVILDHSKHPRNFGVIEDATCHAEGYNPLCGDRVTVYVSLDDSQLSNVRFTGSGCAICTASASMMTQFLKGKPLSLAESTFLKFRDLVMGSVEADQVMEDLDKLTVFTGVREFPMRVKCATLPWHTLKAALENPNEVVTTE